MTYCSAPRDSSHRGATVIADSCGRVVRIAGRVDARTSAAVREGLHGAILAGDGDLTVHLGEAEVWDATGLGVIVGAHHHAQRRGRRLVVADASPRLHRLIRGTRLARVLTVKEAAPTSAHHAA